ncbi:winged helix DNA-binding domain-containing protein [Amycolatopsis sp. DSM 110486]|uniref:winged helix DNA-binding domain-containing protein n=1 Tax=Amycolatopsis sp. DSM 110486 TaxID=2865832 RepID=UPI001C69E1B7|nr:winged helix DNA-binding domain-containing protein [Amycolatopsis sp. DSM 110486]QYN17640.1 winged helix DNA-binding domain-containing protein [Amycolatopsis sp. DSM 110486]
MKISLAQRRARLGVRHHLAAPAATVEEAAGGVVALHATDPASVFLAAWARAPEVGVADVERALYEDRTLLRLLGMRRTVFVAEVATAALVQAGCASDIAVKQRKLLEQHLGTVGHPTNVEDPPSWLADVAASVEKALRARGSATAQDLVDDEPRLRQQLHMAKGKPYAAIGNVTSRVLFQLAVDGRIVRGRPRGSWLSTQYHWAPLDGWLPGGLPPVPPADARAELARRWLRAFGPAPVADLRWWTGWTAGQTKQALAAVAPTEVDLDGEPGLVLSDDLEPVPEPAPWVALLPALDPTPMGWSARDWYLGPHRPALFDRSGNIGPTAWCDGRVVGAWAQRPTGEVVLRLLEDVGADRAAALEAEAARLTTWLGDTRVVPKFRTPAERELST